MRPLTLSLATLLALSVQAFGLPRPTNTRPPPPRATRTPTQTRLPPTEPPTPTDTPAPIETDTPIEIPTATDTPVDTPVDTPEGATDTPAPGNPTPTPPPPNTPLTIAFREAATFRVGAAPAAITTGDFDADGKVDLIVADRTDGTVQWLQGKGTGAFNPRAATLIGPQTEPLGIAASDFDGDGFLDVATADSGDGSIALLFGQGTGKFDTPVTTAVGARPVALLAQGNQLVVVDAGANSVLLVSVGSDRSISVDGEVAVGNQPVGIAAGDLNGDGLTDFVVASHGDNTITVLLGNADQSLTVGQSFTTGAGPSAVALGDLNGDGRLDAVVAETDDNTISVWLGDGAGGFARVGTPIVTGLAPVAIAIADDVQDVVSNDGKPDVLVVNAGTSDVTVLAGKGDGHFTILSRLLVGSDPTALVLGQFTANSNDTQVDVAVCATQAPWVAVLRSTAPRSFTAALNFPVGVDPVAISAADFNHNGTLDAVVANGASNDVALLLGNGRGSFGVPTSFPAGSRPTAAASGDFDGDGSADVVVANAGSGLVSFLRGKTTGGFAAPVTITVGATAGRLLAVDVDRDGHPDLTVTEPGANQLAVLLTDGGNFGTPKPVGLDGSPVAVAAGDVNGDSIIDLIAAVTAPAGVEVMFGNGDGSFQAPILTTLDDDPLDLAVGDFDEDGIVDLAVLSGQSATVHILRGTGDGHFDAVADLQTPAQPQGIAVTDFNGDLHGDIAVASSSEDIIAVYTGMGTGDFSDFSRFAVGHEPVAFIVADFSGDRLPDILVINAAGQNMTVLRNTTRIVIPLPSPTPTNSVGPLTPTPPPPPTPTDTAGPGTPTAGPPPRPTKTPAGSASSGGGGSGCSLDEHPAPFRVWTLVGIAAALHLARRRLRDRVH